MENVRDADRLSRHCTFCDLVRGAAEVSICHEDADSIAFMDTQPVNNGHVLVVPREHYESLLDVPPELGAHLFQVTMKLTGAITRVTGCKDFNIVVNSGAAAGQDEPHYHVHLIPRREGDGFDIPLPFGGSEMPDRTVLDAYAARIIAALRDPMHVSRGAHGGRGDGDGGSVKRSEVRVPVPTFDESRAAAGLVQTVRPARRTMPRRVMRWRLSEGAHGEIVREPAPGADGTSDDAA